MRGKILSFFTAGGYGHLCDDQSDEYCFYSKDLKTATGQVQIGDQVRFDVYRGRGVRAVNVHAG
ncbi:MAG: hypothetical protein K8I00_01290 [Candidatus Omnitrophica bacterium]|nr:hypothetical protein [Candidatus Omnitrophota bacterium]